MAVGFVAAMALAGCGDDSEPGAPVTTRAVATTSRSTALPTTAAPSAGKLSRAEACKQFYATIADLRLNDQQSAVAFTALAGRTADPTLAAAIQRVANGFARNAESISSTEVQTLCR